MRRVGEPGDLPPQPWTRWEDKAAPGPAPGPAQGPAAPSAPPPGQPEPPSPCAAPPGSSFPPQRRGAPGAPRGLSPRLPVPRLSPESRGGGPGQRGRQGRRGARPRGWAVREVAAPPRGRAERGQAGPGPAAGPGVGPERGGSAAAAERSGAARDTRGARSCGAAWSGDARSTNQAARGHAVSKATTAPACPWRPPERHQHPRGTADTRAAGAGSEAGGRASPRGHGARRGRLRGAMKLNERSLAFYATCDSPADSTGFLYKRGERHGAYQRRWFVLKGNMLFYFEERESREPVGVIVLEGCTVELCDSRDDFAFAIRFGGARSRTYVLAAESHAAMEAWVKALSRASFDYMRLVVRELERQLARAQRSSSVEWAPEREAERELEQAPEWEAERAAEQAQVREAEQAPVREAEQAPIWAPERRAPRENGCAVWSIAPGAVPRRASSCEAEAGPGLPPVLPRWRASSGEPSGSPVGASSFCRLHERYGSDVARLRREWLERQQRQRP